MKVEFEIGGLTSRIVGAMQELQFAIAEAQASLGPVPVTGDNGKYAEWQESSDSIEKGEALAKQLVSDWAVNWSEDPEHYNDLPASEQPEDRSVIIARYKGAQELTSFLKHGEGAVQNLVSVGATEQMATNIITVGSIFGAWPIIAYDQ